jgi:hypothetical protein
MAFSELIAFDALEIFSDRNEPVAQRVADLVFFGLRNQHESMAEAPAIRNSTYRPVQISGTGSFGNFVSSEIEKWGKVVRLDNIKPE